MLQYINEPISVSFVYDHLQSIMRPASIRWDGRVYKITQWGYHHKLKTGAALQHIFSVTSDTLAFKLRLDTETLVWYLEEISDGVAN